MSSRDFLILSIFTFLTVAAWIIAEAYHAAVTSTITSVEEKLMKPLEPSFDQKVITQVREKYGIQTVP